MPGLAIPDDRTGLRLLALDPPEQRRLHLAVLRDAAPSAAAAALLDLAGARFAAGRR